MSSLPAERQHGFTLIELLVIVSILAILMGLLLPSLRQARYQAYRVKSQSHLRQIGLGLTMYADVNRGHPPVAAPHELGGPQGRVPESDPWLPARMFGGSLPAPHRPLNAYLSSEVFESPCDKGEPLWWFDTEAYQGVSTAFELYGSSYIYASGYNRMGGVLSPMGIARFVGSEFSYGPFAETPLPLGRTVRLNYYRWPTRKVMAGSIPIHRTMSGVVAPSSRAQWYRRDPDRLWANAVFLDGHVAFVRVFPYEPEYQSINTRPDPAHPYY